MAAHGLTARCGYMTQEDVKSPGLCRDGCGCAYTEHALNSRTKWGEIKGEGFAFAPLASMRGTAQVRYAPSQHGSRRRHFCCFRLKKVGSGKVPWYQVLDSSVPATAFCPNPQQHVVPALGSGVWSAQGCSCLISSSGQNLLS